MAGAFQNKTERFSNVFKQIHGVLILSALFVVLSALSFASPRAASETDRVKPDRATQGKIIDWICDTLNENYVYPDVAKKMESHVRDRFKAGAYNRLNDLGQFTEVLKEDLLSICNDGHLRVRVNPDPPPPDSSTDEEKEKARNEKIERERRENFSFKKVERLPGNVGYLRFDGFDNALYAGPTAVAAMNFLANCDALIIDLRYNGGGDGTMIQLLLSYFFEDPVHYNNMYFRKRDVTEQNWTSAHVQGPKMTDVDLYVLTSSRTFSAAEEFTYDLKNLDRATIVGETTGGGAHPVEMHYLRELDIELKVPFGRSFNPKTGLDWEVVGIEPHKKVAKEKAFDAAYTLALKYLYVNAEEGKDAERKWMWEYQKAVTDPVSVRHEILKSYAGEYGPIRIRFEEGDLSILEPGESEYKRLCALSETLFVIDGNERIRGEFEKNEQGEVIGILGLLSDGSQRRMSKTK